MPAPRTLVTALALLLSLPVTAGAQGAAEETPSEAEATPPSAEAPTPEAEAPPEVPLPDDEAYWSRRERFLASTLQLHASAQGYQRRAVAGITLTTGTLMVAMGAVADGPWDDAYGVYLWGAGAGAVVVGTVAVLVRTPMERVQLRYLEMGDMGTRQRVTTTERLWARQAMRGRRLHHAAFWIELVLGSASIASSFVVGYAAGLDVPESYRRSLALGLGLGGTLIVSRGVTHWFAISDLELGYQAYQRTIEDRTVQYRLDVSAVRGGGVLGMVGTF